LFVNIKCIGVTVEAQAQKSLSVSGNNYVKVWEKGPICRRSKGFGDGPQSSAIFTMFFKNNAFTAYFGLKFLMKIMFLNC